MELVAAPTSSPGGDEGKGATDLPPPREAARRGRPPAGGKLEGGRSPEGVTLGICARLGASAGAGGDGAARPHSEALVAGSGAGGGGEPAVGAGHETDADGGCGGAPTAVRVRGGEEREGLVNIGSGGRGGEVEAGAAGRRPGVGRVGLLRQLFLFFTGGLRPDVLS